MMRRDLSVYAPAVLRFAMVAVYLWFGVSQLTNPAMWTALVPAWATQPIGISAYTVILLNGWLEVIGAILLAIGIWVRPVAAILFLHLLVIAFDAFQGGSALVGVRDFGLSFATCAVALFGIDEYCYDPFARRPKAASPSA